MTTKRKLDIENLQEAANALYQKNIDYVTHQYGVVLEQGMKSGRVRVPSIKPYIIATFLTVRSLVDIYAAMYKNAPDDSAREVLNDKIVRRYTQLIESEELNSPLELRALHHVITMMTDQESIKEIVRLDKLRQRIFEEEMSHLSQDNYLSKYPAHLVKLALTTI